MQIQHLCMRMHSYKEKKQDDKATIEALKRVREFDDHDEKLRFMVSQNKKKNL